MCCVLLAKDISVFFYVHVHVVHFKVRNKVIFEREHTYTYFSLLVCTLLQSGERERGKVGIFACTIFKGVESGNVWIVTHIHLLLAISAYCTQNVERERERENVGILACSIFQGADRCNVWIVTHVPVLFLIADVYTFTRRLELSYHVLSLLLPVIYCSTLDYPVSYFLTNNTTLV